MAITPTLWKAQTQVNTTDPGAQSSGRIVSLPDGGYVVVWIDPSGTFNPLGGITIVGQRYDALGQKVSSTGAPGGGEFRVVPADPLGQLNEGDIISPAVAMSAVGFVTAYVHVHNGQTDIRVVRNSNNISSDILVDSGATVANPAITWLSDDTYVVAYTEGSGADTDIVARIVSFGGTVSAQFDIHNQSDNSDSVKLATLSNGNFVAVFRDEDNGSAVDTDILFRIFNPAGGAVTASILVDDNSHLDSEPHVAALSGGGFVVVWTNAVGDSNGQGINAKVYDNAGNVITGKFQVNTTTAGNQNEPNVVALPDGGFVISWEDDNAGVVRAQRYDALGNRIGREYTVHNALGPDDGGPQASVLADGRIAYAFGDTSSGDADVVTAIWDPRSTVIFGANAGDQSGHSVASAGDVNGDGYADVVIGARFANGGVGAGYVVFGTPSGLPSSVDLAAVAAGSGGFVIQGGTANDNVGWWVASAGDVNGDGFDDVIIGAPGTDRTGGAFDAGAAYVVFGGNFGVTPAPVDLSDIAAGIGGFLIRGADGGDVAGWSVSSADVNGDGFDDLIIGAQAADGPGGTRPGSGETYVVFGGASSPSNVDLASFDSNAGIVINGVASGDASGVSVSNAGDVNGDGYDDLLIGARFANADGISDTGEAYVVFGGPDGFPQSIDLADVGTTIGGFVVRGDSEGALLGHTVSGIGDVNGDGFDDIALGAPFHIGLNQPNGGNSYVIFGRSTFPTEVFLTPDGTSVSVFHGINGSDTSGWAVSGAGDINGDGYDDFLIGAPGGDGPGNVRDASGEVYVVFGHSGAFAASTSLTNIANGTGGFAIFGNNSFDNAGFAVSSAGDIDGDGYDDLIIGASVADGAANDAGESYILYGSATIGGASNATGHVTHQGSDGDDVLISGGGNDIMIGGRGDDTLHGAPGGIDVLIGGQGDDVLIVGDYGGPPTFRRIDGGTGNDILAFVGSIELTDADFRRISDIEGMRLGNSPADIALGPIAARAINGRAADGFRLTIDGSLATGVAVNIDGSAFGRPLTIDLRNNSGVSTLIGGTGNDIFTGGSGDDTLTGGEGDDTLEGGAGNDQVFGGAGDDTIIGGSGAGDDIYDGGDDVDTVSYASTTLGVLVNLGLAQDHATGAEIGTDQLIDIENVIGGSGNDTLVGASQANRFDGGAGNDHLGGGLGDDVLIGGAGDDVLHGGAGADELVGGAGFDAIWYTDSDAAVNVSLKTGAASGGHADGDTFTGIEKVIGSQFNDVLTGNGADNVLDGWSGDDELSGANGADSLFGNTGDDLLSGGAGADLLDGGDGFDTASYQFSGAAVNVSLKTGTGSGADAEGDTLTGIEALIGSAFDDTLTGNGFDNVLSGGNGNDTLAGANGDDTLNGGAGDDILSGGAGADTLIGGAGSDTASYQFSNAAVNISLKTGVATGGHAEGDSFNSVENLIGSAFSDALTGNGANNTLNGGAGNDTLLGGDGNDTLLGGAGADVHNGGTGFDTASYALSSAGVTVDLKNNTGAGGDAAGDTFISIEKIIGSKFNDILLGNGLDNSFNGGAGDDILQGAAGNDFLVGGAGNDTFVYKNNYGIDTVGDYQAGADRFDLTAVSGLNTYADVRALMVQSGAHVVIDFGGGNKLKINNTTIATLDANQGDFLV
jgi:Ca2+-binding RTX toxin-like protein